VTSEVVFGSLFEKISGLGEVRAGSGPNLVQARNRLGAKHGGGVQEGGNWEDFSMFCETCGNIKLFRMAQNYCLDMPRFKICILAIGFPKSSNLWRAARFVFVRVQIPIYLLSLVLVGITPYNCLRTASLMFVIVRICID
jgi:hypothetical protein